ncbi:MAG TPA: aminopeptidase P N-terminal domain-containing protein [Candidatus Angelobacter sp.]|nr:aminopeptidase P N-terminal domain-containing protein [Candidatus Angelobacter sp.]
MKSARYSLYLKRFLTISLTLASLPATLALQRQPNADYRARRQALAQKMAGGVAILFAGTEAEGPNAVYGFRQDNNFYYLSGWTEPGAALIVVSEIKGKENVPGRPYSEILFLPLHNVTQEKWTGPKLAADTPQVASITGFDRVASLDQMPAELARIFASGSASVFVDQSDDGTISPSTSSLDWLRRTNSFPMRTSMHDVKPLLAQLRTVKDAGEVELVRKATNASIESHLAALRMIQPGINEHDVSAVMQYQYLKHGCERPAYAPIVGAGANSTVLHYSADDAPVKAGEVVVMDVAGEYSMYASDITRTAPASGKFTDRQREIYNIVLGAQRAVMAEFKAGKSTLTGRGSDSLSKVAYDYINSHGKDLHGQPLGQYFIHGVGHYVGLEVHDPGDPGAPIPRGAVFTDEPGIYIPEEKLGVRIEDIMWVDSDGKLVNLTAALPHTAEEIEAAMAGTFKPKP